VDLIQPAAFSLLAWGLSVGSGAAATAPTPSGPRIDVLRVETRGPDVIIRFHLLGGINPELARKIEAGLETAIRYDVRLYRRYPYWFDDFVEARRYRIAATYDPVTREYVVEETMDGKALRRTTTRDFSEVSRLLVSRENLLVFRVGPGKPRRNLYVQMRASFDSGYLFTIIPVDSRTPWKKSKRFNLRSATERPPSGSGLRFRSPDHQSPDHPIATRSEVQPAATNVIDEGRRSDTKK
jgi:Domain of unknown function (DUF4390)